MNRLLPILILPMLALASMSALSFRDHGYFPGVVFALLAISPIVWVVMAARARKSAALRPRPTARLATPRARVLLAAAVVVALGAVGYSVYWGFWVPKASHDPITHIADLAGACNDLGREYYPDAAAYSGSSPHPVAIFVRDTADKLKGTSPSNDAPREWNGQGLDVHDVQLIACLGEASDGKYLGNCQFSDGKLPRYQGIYDTTLYEATTGKKVGEARLAGSTTSECPYVVFTKGGNPKLHTQPDLAEFRRALGKFVTG